MADWTWVSRTGERLTIAMTLSVAADDFAAQVGFLCVGRDVTEQRHSQEMLLAALEKEHTAVARLRQLDEAKNEFVSTVSHELRTPVTSIVGYTEMLSDGSLVEPDPDQVPLLETIARNGQRLIALCDDLLMLSGMDSDAVNWQRGDLRPRHAPDAGRGVHPAPPARAARSHLEFVPAAQPLLVLGDRDQLERVLINLLGNAVKFTEDGGRIDVHPRTARDRRLDRGHATPASGSPQHEHDGLFQRFFRASTAQDRAIQGTGLGLSIVVAIVAAPTAADRRRVRGGPRHHLHRAAAPPDARSDAQPGAGLRWPVARLTALMTALSDAVTMLGSRPTPHKTWSPTAHSTYAAAGASPPDDSACSA